MTKRARENTNTMFSSTCGSPFVLAVRQADLEERVKRDVESARERRRQASARQELRLAEEERRKTAAGVRWADVAGDKARLLKFTKVRCPRPPLSDMDVVPA